jgi:hypothetical protein
MVYVSCKAAMQSLLVVWARVVFGLLAADALNIGG